jgi:hypothetical protein
MSEGPPVVNHSAPPGPVVMPSIGPRGQTGMGGQVKVTCVMAPAVVIRPIGLLTKYSAPSGPVVMGEPAELPVGRGNCVAAPAVVIRPTEKTLVGGKPTLPVAVNQRLPSGPAVIPPRLPLKVAVGRGNSVMTPAGVIRPMMATKLLFPTPLEAVNHRLPSGPAVMPEGAELPVGRVNSVRVPAGVIRPMAPTELFPLVPEPVNHRLPSGPTVMPEDEELPVGRVNSVRVPAGVICPMKFAPGLSPVNHRLPSGPTVMPPVPGVGGAHDSPEGQGTGNMVTVPAVVIRPTQPAEIQPNETVNHRLPSGPAVMPKGEITPEGSANVVTVWAAALTGQASAALAATAQRNRTALVAANTASVRGITRIRFQIVRKFRLCSPGFAAVRLWRLQQRCAVCAESIVLILMNSPPRLDFSPAVGTPACRSIYGTSARSAGNSVTMLPAWRIF